MKHNAIEREIVFLRAVKELIDEMVNFEIGEISTNKHGSMFIFKSSTHKKFFNIMLVDFLSCSDKRLLGEQTSYLRALKSICAYPKFNSNNSVSFLCSSVKLFIDWLEKEIIVENIWFPSVQIETNLSIKRFEFIKICGNISKHNFSRLSGVAYEIKTIFKRNGYNLRVDQALTTLEDFHEWFHKDILSYHASAIAEFLNNIRWGIYEYLQPEFKNSISYEMVGDLRKYSYRYPDKINTEFAKSCYWGLMNEISTEPYIPVFEVAYYLKEHH